MSNWSGSTYEGEEKDGWFHGRGRYTYPDGVVYQGQFDKGEFHGKGTLIYPNGVIIYHQGRYIAKWNKGKMLQGDYYFADNLKYQFNDWNYSVPQDRRFYQQFLNGIKPSGATQLTKEQHPYQIPQGTYGQGYYEPIKSIIYHYNGQILRTPSQQQVQNIVRKCRYNPRKLQISGQQDKIIKEVVSKKT